MFRDMWSKKHSSFSFRITLYADIVICEGGLWLLPENGVPIEIQSTARHSTDVESVIQEHEGYVPSNDAKIIDATVASTAQEETNGNFQVST